MAVKKQVVIFDKPRKTSLKKETTQFGDKEWQEDIKSSVEEEKLDLLVAQSARVILDIKSVFPFNFFPDELLIDETKVSIHTNYFFYTKEIRSMEYSDIFNVVTNQGLFFAKLEIVDRYFSQQSITIDFLKKSDALLARRLIQGLVIAKKEKVDTTSMSTEDLIYKLSDVGNTR